MSFILANFLGNSNNSGDSVENKQLIIEKLTAKMTNSAHLEDRKAAAQTIKSLARSHRLEIGTLALQPLIDELRRDLEDEELAKIVLETLDILCSNSGDEEAGIEVQFCEILLKNDQNVTLLLDLMGDSDDFYLRFTSIQILVSLTNSQPFQLQSAVLNSPSGVSKVLDLLKDSREIVRNEGLLLCGALVRGNADLQKILAFQGAFEQVMQIIVEEQGPWTGPIIIQDAFNLISGMLNLNTSNQIYFRDSVCFKQLAGLLALPSPENDSDEDFLLWNRTRIANYLAALSVLDVLLCKENVDLEASQNSALRTHFQGPLLILAFSPKIPSQVSASALNCLSGLIWSNNRAQQEIAKEKLTQFPTIGALKIDPPISPLMAAILLAIHGNSTMEGLFQRSKALELVEAFCSGNPEGQLVLLSTLKVSDSASPGSILLEALFDLDSSRKKDPWHCWYAAILLSHLINKNEEGKSVLLKHCLMDPEIEDYVGEGDEDILTSLMINLIRITTDSRGSTCQKSIIGYLQLLTVWFNESPESIKKFLQEGSFVQYLIERITQQSYSAQDTEIQGFSALIMGICVLYNDESVKNFGSEALKGIIKNRIGPDLFVSRLSRLKSNANQNEVVCDLSKEILMKNYENLMNLVVKPTPAGSKASHTATLAQLTKDLEESRALLTATQSHLTETCGLSEKLKIGISERDAYILQLQKLISEKNHKIAQMAHEMSNFELQQQQQQQMQMNPDYKEYYEKYLSDQAALQSLNETLKTFQETVTRQQARIEELEALLATYRGPNSDELEKWKRAYHELYDQVKEQLSFNLSEGRVVEKLTEPAVEQAIEVIEQPLYVTEQAVEVTEQAVDVTKVTVDHFNKEIQASATLSTDVEILSPSMFMSPIIEDNEPILISEPVESDNMMSEFLSVNKLPEVDKSNEYPELKETIDTSFNAAVIVSEEFAKNEPNPSEDEIVQNISSECPPDNFLSSDQDDTFEIASKEEIKNVLDFFENLPDSNRSNRDSTSADSSNEIGNLQTGLDQLNFEDNRPVVEADQQVPETFNEKLEKSFEIPADDLLTDDVQIIDTQSEAESEAVNNGTINHYNQLYSETETQPEQSDLNYTETQQQEYNYENHEEQVDQNVHESMTAKIDDYFSQEASQDFLQQSQAQAQDSYNQYAEPYNQEMAGEQSIANESYNQEYNYEQPVDNQEFSYEQPAESSYNQEYSYEQSAPTEEFNQEYNTEGYAQDYTSTDYNQDYSNYQQEYPTEAHVSYEYPTETQVSQNYPTETQAYEYPTEAQETSEYATEAQETSEYGTEAQVSYEYPTEAQPSYEYPTESQPSYEYNTGTQVQHEYYNESQPSQEYYNESSQDFSQYAQNVTESSTQNYDYSTTDITSVTEQPQEYSTTDYSVNQVESFTTTDYSAEAGNNYYDQTPEYSDYQALNEPVTEVTGATTEPLISEPVQAEPAQDYSYDQSQEQSSEYYYYDETTGYTYGFDQNVNQYYYYDPNTGEYTYYTATEEQTDPNATATDDGYYTEAATSEVSSNPSLFDTTGPPMVPLQQQAPMTSSSLSANNFVADQIYNL